MRDVQGRVGSAGRTEIWLARGDGYRAGVWSLSVDGPEGPLGVPVSITLEGVNGSDVPPHK